MALSQKWTVRAAFITAGVVSIAGLFNLTAANSAGQNSAVARGSYLVHGVALCSDCHGPSLKGGPIPFMAPKGFKMWNPKAPNIRNGGVNKYSEEDIETIVMTGHRPGGIPFLAPMPHYRMNKQDAHAVAAYIKSLK